MCFVVTAYADTKIYVDKNTGKEVQDLGGNKSIAEINNQFNGVFTDITDQRKEEDADNIKRVKQDKDKRDQERLSAESKLRGLGLTNSEIRELVK